MTFKIATWNVNSIKVRYDHVKTWLNTNQPDVLMIQELKGLKFPKEDFEQLGYHSHAVTQKAYNGVATLSKHPMKIEHSKLPGDKLDEQARYLECTIQDMKLINIYLPNGNPVDSDKYPYKLSWMDRLKDRLKSLRADNSAFAVGGDFNVIPEARDCYDPKSWESDALFRLQTRQKFRALIYLGLTDAFRAKNQEAGMYSYWDYQRGAWDKNNGIRIDHFLLSPPLADRLVSCTIDQEPRGWDTASDHTPVLMVIE